MVVNTLLKVLEQLLHKIKANRRREMRIRLHSHLTRTPHARSKHKMQRNTYAKLRDIYFCARPMLALASLPDATIVLEIYVLPMMYYLPFYFIEKGTSIKFRNRLSYVPARGQY